MFGFFLVSRWDGSSFGRGEPEAVLKNSRERPKTKSFPLIAAACLYILTLRGPILDDFAA